MGSEGKKEWNSPSAAAATTGGESELMSEFEALSGIPSSSLSIEISSDAQEMKPRLVDLCKDLFRKWSCLDDSNFSVETISGGITNLLLKITVREDRDKFVPLTVRLFGPNTDLVIDRKRELQALPYLAAAGFGAELLGLFSNGMVQSFIEARTLEPSDMSQPRLVSKIARKLRDFHNVVVPGSREPQLWNDISKFLAGATGLNFDDRKKQARYETISFKAVHDEITELKELSDKLNSPVVFSHNDLLSGNLMLNDDQEKLYFIDFEYGSYSYRGYDIANHFNEYAGLQCDYNLYPNKEAQYHFFRSYLHPDKPHEVPDEDLRTLHTETNTFRLASHIYWALWALIQAKVSTLDFDYLEYYFCRYGEYKRQKESCFVLAKEHLFDAAPGSCRG